MMILCTSLLALLAVPALVSCSYLLLLTLFSQARRSPAVASRRTWRFDVIVPAHDEQALIARTVGNLLQMERERAEFRVLVVADNCSDGTAALARAAGAHVLERRHEQLRGKGYALEFAFQHSRSDGWADAVVVIDADSMVSPNLLTACALRLDEGAQAVQVYYGVLDPHSSWRTRLMCIALSAFHKLRSRARERFRLSSGLRGNGWCVTHEVMQRVPYRAFSLAEDIEYGIELGLAGERVHYADEAEVAAEMVNDAASATTQRRRWEQGRLQLIANGTRALLRAARRQRSWLCVDLAMDLLVLPLAYVAINVVALLGVATLLWLLNPAAMLWPALWLGLGGACAVSLVLYVLRGWQLSGMGARGLLDLARAPFFVAWKVLLMLQPRGSLEWVRTRRKLS
jgi:cellulose synthase/poly-beta-1,6-N-acetylglucosamine synthase-like glycosyltransferase